MFVQTLDVRDFETGSPPQKQKFAQDIVQSFIDTGFVKVSHHAISDRMIDELFEWNKKFFALPAEVKAKTEHPPSRNTAQRGFSSVGTESTGYLRSNAGKNLIDSKEHFDQGSTCDTIFPNRWPSSSVLPGFREFMERYYDAIYTFSLQMLTAMEIGLNIPLATFTGRCKPSASDLRLNHYPAITVRQRQNGSTRRIWPHTDFGLITPLLQDNVGGLEIEDRDHPGCFLPVPCTRKYDIILNVSDTLERWTNGVLRAGVHQVTVPVDLKDKEAGVVGDRYSVAFFFKADREQRVEPLQEFLKQFLKEGEEAEFESMTQLEFQRWRTQSMYAKD